MRRGVYCSRSRQVWLVFSTLELGAQIGWKRTSTRACVRTPGHAYRKLNNNCCVPFSRSRALVHCCCRCSNTFGSNTHNCSIHTSGRWRLRDFSDFLGEKRFFVTTQNSLICCREKKRSAKRFSRQKLKAFTAQRKWGRSGWGSLLCNRDVNRMDGGGKQ